MKFLTTTFEIPTDPMGWIGSPVDAEWIEVEETPLFTCYPCSRLEPARKSRVVDRDRVFGPTQVYYLRCGHVSPGFPEPPPLPSPLTRPLIILPYTSLQRILERI